MHLRNLTGIESGETGERTSASVGEHCKSAEKILVVKCKPKCAEQMVALFGDNLELNLFLNRRQYSVKCGGFQHLLVIILHGSLFRWNVCCANCRWNELLVRGDSVCMALWID